jgi:hypothetical protein
MTDFLKFQLPGTMCSPARSLRLSALFVLVALFGASSTSAQEAELFKCPEKEYKFSGSPAETLCDENQNFICETEIGVGTPFPKSSLWGASITGNVCIIGDFKIDAPFSFQSAKVKINPGVTISVDGSPNGLDPGSTLSINNSKLFACNGLWKGIRLAGFLSAIGTSNNSVIEDAEIAIYASGFTALGIQQTIFNRNRIGIELVTPFPSVFVPGPIMWTFSDNHFTCDAPLNGTVDEITTAGVKLTDSFLGTSQSGTNTFTDIQYGIYSEGGASYIGCQNLVFQGIRHDGIYMDQGNINLRASQFVNGYEKGIHIVTANNVIVSGNCVFTWDDNLPLLVPDDWNYYHGIHIEKFSVGSNTNVNGNLFSAVLTSGKKRVIGTWYEGADVAGGTAIGMTQNTWHMYGGANVGVVISGNFPSTSQIDIFNNDFDIQDQLNVGSPICISSDGNRYNFDIIGNRFYNFPPSSGWASGIQLFGSEGTGNQVSENHFEPGTPFQSYLIGIQIQDFKNTTFCANTFMNAARSFVSYGQNDGTVFTRNIAYGSQLICIHYESWIEDQDQMGNQWTAEYQGVIFPLVPAIQAECFNPDFAGFSEFFVHTAQSTALAGQGFNPFHPKNISPDVNNEFWDMQSGTPASGCLNEIAGPGSGDSNLKRAVADGSLAAQFTSDLSMIWQAKRALFFALKRHPSLEGEYAAYSTFMNTQTGSNIDKFYQVFTGIDAARNGSATLVANAQNNRVAMENLLIQIEADDLAWQNATTPAEKESAKNAKIQHLSELMQLLQNAAGYQSSYKQGMQSALPAVQQVNNSVTSVSDWEIYEKTSNDIFISYLLNEGITYAQKLVLEGIASVCPKYGGMAVYNARGILPDCAMTFDRDNYQGCYPSTDPVGLVSSRSDENQSLAKATSAQLSPNPANGLAMLNIPEGKQGDIQIVNTLGRIILSQKIASSQTSLNLSLIPAGTYYLNLLYSDGQRESIKLVVTQ